MLRERRSAVRPGILIASSRAGRLALLGSSLESFPYYFYVFAPRTREGAVLLVRVALLVFRARGVRYPENFGPGRLFQVRFGFLVGRFLNFWKEP